MHTRNLLGVTLVCAYAAYASAGLVKLEQGVFAAGGGFGGKDSISAYEERFSGVRRFLPPHGTVGYLNDVADHTENRASKSLTQYALAPLIVVDSIDSGTIKSPWIVGNFYYKVPDAVATERLLLVRNFGNGVFLFTRNAR